MDILLTIGRIDVCAFPLLGVLFFFFNSGQIVELKSDRENKREREGEKEEKRREIAATTPS